MDVFTIFSLRRCRIIIQRDTNLVSPESRWKYPSSQKMPRGKNPSHISDKNYDQMDLHTPVNISEHNTTPPPRARLRPGARWHTLLIIYYLGIVACLTRSTKLYTHMTISWIVEKLRIGIHRRHLRKLKIDLITETLEKEGIEVGGSLNAYINWFKYK